MIMQEVKLDDALLETLISLSGDWAAENSCYGYYQNKRSDIEGNRVFLAAEEDSVQAYLIGHVCTAERTSSIMEEGTPYFEVDELYVRSELRSRGIGRALYSFAEETVKAEGVDFMMLTTATKDYKKILHFYIEEMGLDFWSARLYKKLR